MTQRDKVREPSNACARSSGGPHAQGQAGIGAGSGSGRRRRRCGGRQGTRDQGRWRRRRRAAHAVDQLKDRLKSAVVVLASVENAAKVVLVVGVTADQTSRIKAGELVGAVAAQVGGRGGGRADFAQAGGSKPAALDAALASVQEFVRARLAA